MALDGLAEAYDQLKLSHDLAEAINAAPSVEAAFAATLRLFSEAGNWVVAQVWLPDRTGEVLVCGPVWYERESGFETFRRASLGMQFRRGEPLLGSVWQDGPPRWAEDIDADVSAFRRADAAAALGHGAALVVPVCTGDEVLAVLEFLTREQGIERSGLRDLITAAAAQLSSLMARKQAEADLRRSEARFRAVADTAYDSIVSIDATGRINYVNAEGARLFGCADGSLVGAPVTKLIPERFLSAHLTGFARHLETGERRLIGKTVLVRARRRDGSELPIELSLATWEDQDSPQFTAIIRDVSERQMLQDELQRALAIEQETAARLHELDGLKNTFLDAVSHDLRGPLAAIRAATSVLQRDVDVQNLTVQERRDYLSALRASADKMRRLLDDLLDLDRLSSGEVSLNRQPTDLAASVRRAVDEHRGAFGDRDVDVVWSR